MAYNLPPPWDAGYALPDNVKDEGLERRGFVTKWLPKGTYDNPKVGTAGYAVPKYVTASGYGQGEVVTKWLPRGTQPNVPHYLDRRPQVVSQSSISPRGNEIKFALSGTELPASYRQYGDRAAMAILTSLSSVPVNRRKAALKATLDAIDPSLWTRAATEAAKYQQAGENPIRALHHGLADALSTGVAKEVVSIGKSRTLPPSRSLLGLGAYGREALGAVTTGFAFNPVVAYNVASASSGPQPSANGTCPAGQAAYNWVAATSTVPAHWERGRAGQPAQYCGSIAPSGPPGGVTVSDTHEAILVGPIQLPVNATRGSQVLFPTPGDLTPELKAWVKQIWIGKQPLKNNPNWQTDPNWKSAANPWNSPKTAEWLLGVGFVPGDVVRGAQVMGFSQPDTISYRFKHPVTGEDWHMRVGLTNTNLGGQTMDASKPVQLRVWANPPVDQGLFSRALSLVAKVAKPLAEYGGGVISSALDIVGDLTCQLVTSPNAVQAGAAVGVAAGAGASAGAAGAAIASQFCSQPPPQEIPVASDSGSLILPLAIAGGAVLAVVLLSKKKA